MRINRRDFLLLTAGLTAGCAATDDEAPARMSGVPRVINAGPAANYAADGVYNRYAAVGFFLVRQGERLFALSSYCTHRRCQLKTEPDHSFFCKCHGSTFDPAGHVTEGPAKRDLPVLPMSTNEGGEIVVTVS
jgi:Rieske Fe-S protein